MPRENRKRGKKHKKPAPEQEEGIPTQPKRENPEPEQPEAGPSWIVQQPHAVDTDAEAPFGYLDQDVKAYFRTVDVQMRQWQDGTTDIGDGEQSMTCYRKKHG